jgi:periplasmic protein TonB
MNAMAVPPPTWVPIGAREIQSLARRYLRAGLILSSLCHLALLSAVLVVVARSPHELPLRVYQHATTVDPIPAWTPPISSPPGHDPSHPNGMFDPKDIPITQRPVDPFASVSPGATDEPMSHPGVATTRGIESAVADSEPAEGDFTYFDREPAVIDRVLPAYPLWEREAGISGTVLLHVLVGTDGRVKRVTVIRDIMGLTDPALDAVKRWTFRPAQSNGHPVSVWVEIPVRFSLE